MCSADIECGPLRVCAWKDARTNVCQNGNTFFLPSIICIFFSVCKMELAVMQIVVVPNLSIMLGALRTTLL